MDPPPSPASVPSAWDAQSPVCSWKIHPSEVVPRPPVNPQAMVPAEPWLLCCPVGWRLPPCLPGGQRLGLTYLLQLRRTRGRSGAGSQHALGLTPHPPHHSRRPQAPTRSSWVPPPPSPLCACAFPGHFTDTAWQESPTVSQAPNPTNSSQPSFPCPLPGVRLHGRAISSLVPGRHRRWTLPDFDSSSTVLARCLVLSLLLKPTAFAATCPYSTLSAGCSHPPLQRQLPPQCSGPDTVSSASFQALPFCQAHPAA